MMSFITPCGEGGRLVSRSKPLWARQGILNARLRKRVLSQRHEQFAHLFKHKTSNHLTGDHTLPVAVGKGFLRRNLAGTLSDGISSANLARCSEYDRGALSGAIFQANL